MLNINNTIIPEDAGTSYQLVLRSPLFDDADGKTPGSFIFNTKLPATKELKNVFGQAHRVTRLGRATAELPYVKQVGSLRFSGTCIIQQASDMEFELTFSVKNGTFAIENSTKSLKDLDLGGDRLLSTAPYSIASGNVPFYVSYQDEIQITASEPLDHTHTIVDFTNCFTSSIPTIFKASRNDTYYFSASLSVIALFGQDIKFNISKNNLFLEEIALDTIVNLIERNYVLLEGDEISFHITANSTLNGELHEINIEIEKDYLLSFRTADSLFVAEASGSQGDFDFTVFPVENPNFFDNFPADDFQLDNVNISEVYKDSFFIQNYWKDNHFPYILSGFKNMKHVSAMNVFTPFVYIEFLLQKIGKLLNYEILNSPFAHEQVYENAVLFNTFGENTYTVDDARMINVKHTFNLIDHVHDVSILYFLRAIAKITGRRIDIDTEFKTLKFVQLKSVIESTQSQIFPGIITEAPAITVAPEYKGYKIELKASDKYISERIKKTDPKHNYKGSVAALNLLPTTGNTVNDMYLVTSLNEFYVFKYNTTEYKLSWTFHSKNFYLIKEFGTEPFLQLNVDMAPVVDHNTLDETVGAPEGRKWIIPVSWQSGNFEGFPDLSSESGLQILFFKGLRADSNFQMYPLAISSKKDYGGSIFINPNICVDGATPNIFTEEYSAWLEWLVNKTKPVKLKAVLTPGQLKAINFIQKQRILGTNYLLKEIRVNIVDDHLTEAEIEAYSC